MGKCVQNQEFEAPVVETVETGRHWRILSEDTTSKLHYYDVCCISELCPLDGKCKLKCRFKSRPPLMRKFGCGRQMNASNSKTN